MSLFGLVEQSIVTVMEEGDWVTFFQPKKGSIELRKKVDTEKKLIWSEQKVQFKLLYLNSILR